MIDRVDSIVRAGASGGGGDERERARRLAVPRTPPIPVPASEEPAVAPAAASGIDSVAGFLAEVARLAGSESGATRVDPERIAQGLRTAAAQALGAQARLGEAGVHALLADVSGGATGSR